MKAIKKSLIFFALLLILVIPGVCAENVTIDSAASIQDTVNNVNDNDIIYLTPGTYYESAIEIDKNITLQGLGDASDIIIDGERNNTIILVNSISHVTIRNITFINGYSPDYGGAIHGELGAEFHIDSCNFINNTARINGGAIDIAGEEVVVHTATYPRGFLNATNCIFINNSAYHDGGAVATIWGDTYIYNSEFKYNYAQRDGGAVRVAKYGTSLIENCTIDQNNAGQWGGGLYNWPGSLTVNNSRVTNNTAGERGGGLITAGPLTVTNSLIADNKASSGGALYIDEEMAGNPSTTIFTNNTVLNNIAKEGSLVVIEQTSSKDCTFENNTWSVNPESDEWENTFITNGYAPNPTNYIYKELVKSENNTTPNVPSETNNSTQTSESVVDTIEDVIDEVISGLASVDSKDENVEIGESSSNADKPAHEITKKDVSKQTTTSALPYVIVILIIIIIFGYGYYRRQKND